MESRETNDEQIKIMVIVNYQSILSFFESE